MRVINNLTKPGDIRRVDLTPDTVRVQTSDGQDRIYRISTEMAVSCSWCGKSLGKKEGNGQSGVTHGICPECADKTMTEYERGRNISHGSL